jgi:hypothetical protein
MCCNFNLFYVSYFKFLYNYFIKFIVHKINFEMVKYLKWFQRALEAVVEWPVHQVYGGDNVAI